MNGAMLEWDMQFHVFRMIENGVWAREHSCSSSWNLEPTNESISLNACKSIINNRLNVDHFPIDSGRDHWLNRKCINFLNKNIILKWIETKTWFAGWYQFTHLLPSQKRMIGLSWTFVGESAVRFSDFPRENMEELFSSMGEFL